MGDIHWAKKTKIENVTEYFRNNHRDSPLKYACHEFNENQGDIPKHTLEHEVHHYLVREGFKWVPESECFVGVTEKIYEDAKEIVSGALRKYSSYVKKAGIV